MLRAVSRAVALETSPVRYFHISAISKLRQVTVEKPDEKTTVIDCKYIKSPRDSYVIKLDKKSTKCPLCQLNLRLKYTDVLILCQFIDSNGKIFKHEETSLCEDQYNLVTELIYMAQYAGLLPEPAQTEPKKPYRLLNTYYDETTIDLRPVDQKRNMRMFYLRSKLSPIEKLRVKPRIGGYYGPKIY